MREPAPSDGWSADDDDLTTPELSLTDPPRLPLEELLLGGRTARAGQVLTAQGRLRALLRVNAMVASELNLRPVLRHIVTAARDLVQARYAALGVFGPDGQLEQFIHTGNDEPANGEPAGDRLAAAELAALIEASLEQLRTSASGAPPEPTDSPSDHRQAASVLSVPVRIRGRVLGNLFLTEGATGPFTLEDRQLVVALAANAGVAIENARLFEQSERRQRWLVASAEVAQQLFAGETDRPLELVLRLAARGAAADTAILAMIDGDGKLRVQAATGARADELTGRLLDPDHSLAGRVIAEGEPLLITEQGRFEGPSGPELHAGAAVAVPMMAGDRVLGAMILRRLDGRGSFTETDRDQLAGFSNHAGAALELNQARADREALRILADHDRIASDLHDHVIQELFAVGMGIQGMIHALDRVEHQKRLLGFVDSLDATVRRIRTTIFQLDHNPAAESLQHRVLSVVENDKSVAGMNTRLEFSGPLGLSVAAPLADDVVAVVREALSDAASHPHASTRAIHISLAADQLTVEVTDDGDGIDTVSRSDDLSSLRRRAAVHDGNFEIGAAAAGGNRLYWAAKTSRSGGRGTKAPGSR